MIPVDQQYAISCAPGPGPSGNLKLKAASVGHFVLLSRLGSPLISAPMDLKKGSLATAIWVLSRDWRDSKKSLGSWIAKAWISYDAHRYSSSEEALSMELLHLCNYWRYHTEGLMCWDKDGEDKGGGSIPALFSIQFVLSQLGFTSDEILDHPLKGALASLTAYNAMRNPEAAMIDDAVIDVMNKRRRERAEKQGGNSG